MTKARLAAVAEVSHAALDMAELRSFLPLAVRCVAESLNVDVSGILELDPSHRDLVLRAVAGCDQAVVGGRVPVGHGSLPGFTLLEGKAVVVEDMSRETRFHSSPLMAGLGLVSGICVCLMDGTQPYGVLAALSTHQRRFTCDEVAFLELMAHVISGLLGRMRDAAELERQGRDFEAVVENSPDIIGRIDRDLRYQFVNRAVEEMTGRPRAWWIGRSIEETEENHEIAVAWSRAARKVFETGEVFETIFSYETLAGSRWFQARAVPEPGPGGEIETVLWFGRDLTELRRMDEELRRSEAALRAVIESAMDAIVTFDESCEVILFNGAAEGIFGCSAEDAVGRPFRTFLTERCRESFQRVMISLGCEDASGHSARLSEDLFMIRATGGEFPAEVSLSRGTAGDQILFTVVVRDLTERFEAERALLEKEEQLLQSQKMEAVGRLAGGIAHDFNNLLTIIQGYGGSLLDRFGTDGAVRAEVNAILGAAQRGADLTRRLLAFGRRQRLQPRTFNLNEVIAGIEILMRRILGDDITLRLDLASRLEMVHADPSQIEQVLMNLVVNARDAMSGEGRLTIRTSDVELDESYVQRHAGVAPGRYVAISVSDNGCGMDADTQARIFEPFFTTKHDRGGTGLGLSTVHGIVKQSGGHLWVYSEIGRGTTFKIYLQRAEGAAAQEEVPGTPLFAGEDGARETVLLVEDEELVRGVVQRMLERRGYRVMPQGGMREALDFARGYENRIDVLLTDVIMPGGSGPELADALRMERPEIQVLFMSGYAEHSTALTDMMEAGAALIEKPFSAESLQSQIRRLVDGAATCG